MFILSDSLFYLLFHLLKSYLTFHLYSPGITNGTCKYYNGSVCFQSDAEKNSTNIYRYIDSKIGMEQTDEIFGEFFEALRDRAVSRQECTDILSPAMCTYGIPACYYDGTPQQICREDCEHIMELCKDDLSKLLGAIQYISLKKRIDFAHLAVLEGCGSFQYSYEIDSRSNKTCAYLFKDLGEMLYVFCIYMYCYIYHNLTLLKKTISLNDNLNERIAENNANKMIIALQSKGFIYTLLQF